MNTEQRVAKISFYFNCFYLIYAMGGMVLTIVSLVDYLFATKLLADFYPIVVSANNQQPTLQKFLLVACLINVAFFFYVFFTNKKIWQTAHYNTSLSRTYWWLFILTHLSTLFLFFSVTKIFLPGLSLLGNQDTKSFLISIIFIMPVIPFLLNVLGLIENYLVDKTEPKILVAKS